MQSPFNLKVWESLLTCIRVQTYLLSKREDKIVGMLQEKISDQPCALCPRANNKIRQSMKSHCFPFNFSIFNCIYCEILCAQAQPIKCYKRQIWANMVEDNARWMEATDTSSSSCSKRTIWTRPDKKIPSCMVERYQGTQWSRELIDIATLLVLIW